MFDAEMLKKAREGDLQVIEAICSETWKPLYRFIYFRVQNREEAEDITQETYFKAFRHFGKNCFEPDKFIGFLKAVAMNILRDGWRRKKRRGCEVDFDAINPEEAALEDPAGASIERSAIEEALASLHDEQRIVLELRIIKGYTAAETARIMNKKEGTIRVMQYRALLALAEILGHTDPEGE